VCGGQLLSVKLPLKESTKTVDCNNCLKEIEFDPIKEVSYF
jgi:hypothetical protein